MFFTKLFLFQFWKKKKETRVGYIHCFHKFIGKLSTKQNRNIHSFIHFKKDLLNVFSGPDAVLGAGDSRSSSSVLWIEHKAFEHKLASGRERTLCRESISLLHSFISLIPLIHHHSSISLTHSFTLVLALSSLNY